MRQTAFLHQSRGSLWSEGGLAALTRYAMISARTIYDEIYPSLLKVIKSSSIFNHRQDEPERG
jgi:hypothetical protein